MLKPYLRLQGAAQFARDVQAVAALLAPYTRRPAAHFRELADAAALLALPADHVSSHCLLLKFV